MLSTIDRAVRGVTSFAFGKAKAVANRNPEPKRGMSDATLKSKVETELFRDETVPKGQIEVTVVNGIVELRGQVKRPDDKTELGAQAEAIPEVREVRNLLHLPKTPAPTRS
jgi:osmotically-inducible protein OsmY